MNKRKCIGLVTVALLLPISGLHADRGAVNADGAQRVLEWSTAGNDAVPNIGLPPGRVVTVSFHDAQGAPWPAVQVMGPESDWLSMVVAGRHRARYRTIALGLDSMSPLSCNVVAWTSIRACTTLTQLLNSPPFP